MSLDTARTSIRSEWGDDHFFGGLLEDDSRCVRGVTRILALSGLQDTKEDVRRRQAACDLIRCVTANPFRTAPAVDSAWFTWNGGTMQRLAQGIYDLRVFDRLPLLADALEDAGCTDADLLGHLRGPGPHVRGCWALDLILAKS